jgi:hypothetical protein
MGVKDFNDERLHDAEVSFTTAITLNPACANYLSNRARAFEKLHKYSLAFADVQHALRLSPGDAALRQRTESMSLRVFPGTNTGARQHFTVPRVAASTVVQQQQQQQQQPSSSYRFTRPSRPRRRQQQLQQQRRSQSRPQTNSTTTRLHNTYAKHRARLQSLDV